MDFLVTERAKSEKKKSAIEKHYISQMNQIRKGEHYL